MTWKKAFNDEYKKLNEVVKQIRKAVGKNGVTVFIYKPEFVGDNPEWTTKANIEAVRYVGGEDETVRKVTIWFDEKFEAVQNENSDMLDTDYDSISTDRVDELINFCNRFLH